MNKILKISLWILVVASSITLLSFANHKQHETTCWKLNVQIHNNEKMLFISKKGIENEILNLGTPIIDSRMDEIDIERISKTIHQISAVKSCNVYKTLDGQLQVEVTQRTPIARVLNKDGSGYYLDNEGYIMDLSSNYTAKVPLVTGEINESGSLVSVADILRNDKIKNSSKLDEVFELVKEIHNNEFMSALTDYIYLEKNNDFIIIPRIGRQKIIVGDVSNLDDKFTNLISFYEGTVNKINIDIYKAINIKYDEQVIGIK